MAAVAKKKAHIFTKGAILFCKPEQTLSIELRKWLKLTIYFEEKRVRRGSLFMETVPKFPEWFETGLGVAAFGTTAKQLAALRPYWRHQYRVRGTLGLRTQDFWAGSPVIEEKPAKWVTPSLLESVCLNFVGEITQIYPPTLSFLKRWNEIKRKRPEKYENYFMTEKDFFRAEEDSEEDSDNEENESYENHFTQKSPLEFSRRVVQCHSIELLDLRPPHFELRVVSNALFNCRALVYEIGNRLGCNAVLNSLHLEGLGPFNYQVHRSLAKHELHIENIQQNMIETSKLVDKYLSDLRFVYPTASPSYRFL